MQHNTTLLILDEEDNSLCMETDAILGLISIRLTSSEEVVHAISDVSCTDSVPGCGKAAAPTHCSVLIPFICSVSRTQWWWIAWSQGCLCRARFLSLKCKILTSSIFTQHCWFVTVIVYMSISRVHVPQDSQDAVFEEVKPLLTSLLDGCVVSGLNQTLNQFHTIKQTMSIWVLWIECLVFLSCSYNVCIMAYGQTGSGKTHTMMGSFCQGEKVGIPQETQQGIIPNAAAELFRCETDVTALYWQDLQLKTVLLKILQQKVNFRWTVLFYLSNVLCLSRLISEKPEDSHSVEVSVMEVYNNEVYDLLAKDEQGNPTCQRCDIITTSSGISDVPSLTSELVPCWNVQL